MSISQNPKTEKRGNYLIIEYVGDIEEYRDIGNYALYYERDSEPFAVVNWLNFGGDNGIATRGSIEVSQKSRVEIVGDGSGAFIKSRSDE